MGDSIRIPLQVAVLGCQQLGAVHKCQLRGCQSAEDLQCVQLLSLKHACDDAQVDSSRFLVRHR